MRIVIDLDGTICPIRLPEQKYGDLLPHPGAVEKLNELRKAGHILIIQTARNMETCKSNVGKVMRNIGKITLDWLEKHNIPYDEIYFGKPNADIYIDDRSHRFTNWDEITSELISEKSRPK